MEEEDFRKLNGDTRLIQFLSFHWTKLLNNFQQQLRDSSSYILYSPVSPSEKVALIFHKLQESTIQISVEQFISFLEHLLKFHNFNSKSDLEEVPKIAYSDLKIGTLIGKGGFGNVYKGIWDGVDVAVKQWHLEMMKNDLLDQFLSEAKIMYKCRHPNIVQFFAICVEPANNSLVMELLPNGSLYDLLNDSK